MALASSARGIVVVEAPSAQLGQACRARGSARGLANGEHDRHRLRQQPPRDEPERPGPTRRRATARRRRGRAAAAPRPPRTAGSSTARATRNRSGALAGRQAQRDAQRVPLRLRERVEPVEHRRAQLMQAGERQLHLGLDARDLRDAEPGRLPSAWRSSAVLPMPASPRTTRTALCPPRASASNRSSTRARWSGPGTRRGRRRPWSTPSLNAGVAGDRIMNGAGCDGCPIASSEGPSCCGA